ncbi:MAG: hypothetical protein A2V70_14755 [Planctomycetes bacterium RBG_13_63_9]|nr:MAG: hypothetical protein A2V70_14755 [Planctomycetes bacterium RBG_13_63_9]
MVAAAEVVADLLKRAVGQQASKVHGHAPGRCDGPAPGLAAQVGKAESAESGGLGRNIFEA